MLRLICMLNPAADTDIGPHSAGPLSAKFWHCLGIWLCVCISISEKKLLMVHHCEAITCSRGHSLFLVKTLVFQIYKLKILKQKWKEIKTDFPQYIFKETEFMN